MIVRQVNFLETSAWVNSHNLFMILGKIWMWIFPFGEPHLRLNMLCGVFAAISVHFFFLSAYSLTNRFWPSFWGALAIMVSHSLWWHATILEVYTLNAALIAIIVFFVVRFQKNRSINDVYAACFFWGLGCSNHVLMGLFVVGFLGALWFLIRRKAVSARQFLSALFFFLMGMQIYLFLFLKELNTVVNSKGIFSYATFWEALRWQVDHMTGGHFKKSMFPEMLTWEQQINWRLNYLMLLFLNFPSIIFPMAFVGFWRMRGTLIFIFLCGALLAQIAWSANYLIWDMFAFGMPVWLMFGFLGTVGLGMVWAEKSARSIVVKLLVPTILIGPYCYHMIPKWAKSPGFWNNYFSQFVQVENYWDAPEFFVNPNKANYDLVARLADSIFSKLPQGSHLIDSDGKGYYPFSLYYQQVLGKRPDIKFISIFTPTFTPEQATAIASRVEEILKQDVPVFVSSVTYPERAVLNNLYARWGKDARATVQYAEGLDKENFIKTFPNYQLERISLLPDREAYIYKFTKLGASVDKRQDNFVIEGESLMLEKLSGEGQCLAQSLGAEWSGGGQMLCIDLKPTNQVIFNFETPEAFNGALELTLTRSYDFGAVSISLNGVELKTTDLYAPAICRATEVWPELSLPAGKQELTITVIGANKGAEPRFGFGIDSLRFVSAKK